MCGSVMCVHVYVDIYLWLIYGCLTSVGRSIMLTKYVSDVIGDHTKFNDFFLSLSFLWTRLEGAKRLLILYTISEPDRGGICLVRMR